MNDVRTSSYQLHCRCGKGSTRNEVLAQVPTARRCGAEILHPDAWVLPGTPAAQRKAVSTGERDPVDEAQPFLVRVPTVPSMCLNRVCESSQDPSQVQSETALECVACLLTACVQNRNDNLGGQDSQILISSQSSSFPLHPPKIQDIQTG